MASTQHYRRKWKELKAQYTERCAELADTLGEAGRLKSLNEDVEQSLRKTKSCLESAHRCLPNGYPTSYDYSVVGSEYRVCVFGKYKSYADTVTTACIKAIPIEDGDEEFAIRQAEELIEIIQNF